VTPYYQDDHVTLYHSLWEDVDPALLRADVLVTDPPYGIDWDGDSTGRGGNKHARIHGDDRPFDPAPLLAMGLPTVLWGANHFGSRLPDSPSWLVWDKREYDMANTQADCEMAWTNLGGPARMFRHYWMGMLRASEQGTAYHPTQKPVALMSWVLSRCPEGTVLDPYAGAGPTLVAAKSMGRRAIGVEMAEVYCERAANRLRQEVLGLIA
jgi:site-specific DNA-methyltransferase (adenine-specific)